MLGTLGKVKYPPVLSCQECDTRNMFQGFGDAESCYGLSLIITLVSCTLRFYM